MDTPDKMDLRITIARLLQQSLDLLQYFSEIVPPSWLTKQPGSSVRGVAESVKSPVFQIAHLVGYEERLASPVLRSMAAGGDGTDVVPSGHVSWFRGYVDELASQPVSDLTNLLARLRADHIAIVKDFPIDTFERPLTPLWGVEPGRLESGAWVATKTAQHTIEHANHIARIALFAPDGAD
jgi:hypothetical protein